MNKTLYFFFLIFYFYFMDALASRPAPRRVARPTAKLADGSNIEKAPFRFQRLAVDAENARIKAMQKSDTRTPAETDSESESHSGDSATGTLSPLPSLVSTRQTSPTLSDDTRPLTGTKRPHQALTSSTAASAAASSDNEELENPKNAAPKKKKKRTHRANENSKFST